MPTQVLFLCCIAHNVIVELGAVRLYTWRPRQSSCEQVIHTNNLIWNGIIIMYAQPDVQAPTVAILVAP
jgi:hypothetical protein